MPLLIQAASCVSIPQARPLPNLDAVYRVHESDRPLTVPEELELATDARAAERAVFDQAVGEKIRLNEASGEVGRGASERGAG